MLFQKLQKIFKGTKGFSSFILFEILRTLITINTNELILIFLFVIKISFEDTLDL